MVSQSKAKRDGADWLAGKGCTMNTIKETVAKLNVQVDNLWFVPVCPRAPAQVPVI